MHACHQHADIRTFSPVPLPSLAATRQVENVRCRFDTVLLPQLLFVEVFVANLDCFAELASHGHSLVHVCKLFHLHLPLQVQGVFFRKYTVDEARRLGLVGWCMNTHYGTVKGEMQGLKAHIQQMKVRWKLSTTHSAPKVWEVCTTNGMLLTL